MKSGLFIAACAVLSLASPASAFQSQERQVGNQNSQSFSNYDNNRDGYLSLQEYSSYAELEAGMSGPEAYGAFTSMDANGDQQLSLSEFNSGICCA